MIDIENIVFTRLSAAIRSAFRDATVYGEYVEAPASFPCVVIVEADNSVLERTRTLDNTENYAQVMYEINVYTNDSQGKKTKAKSIANVIDGQMSLMHFTRKFRSQTPNIDRTIYRITMRYSAVVREGILSGGKIVHSIHTND